jgi:hypothetical protein
MSNIKKNGAKQCYPKTVTFVTFFSFEFISLQVYKFTRTKKWHEAMIGRKLLLLSPFLNLSLVADCTLKRVFDILE